MIKFKFLVLTTIFVLVSPRFFDVCPGRRQSIGACLVGLCPAGSECINSYCCPTGKHKKSSTATTIEVDTEENEYGICSSGGRSIGECISSSCPMGYTCESENCCEILPQRRKLLSKSKKEEIPMMKSSPISLITVAPQVEDSGESTSVEQTTATSSTTKKLITTKATTESPDDVRKIIDEEDSELEEEVEEESTTDATTILTTTPTTTTTEEPTTITSTRKPKRVKNKKNKLTTIKTTTTTEEPITTEETVEITETSTPSEETETFVCPVGAPIGECIANKCPEGHGCVEGQCCILTPQINCTDALTGCLTHLCDRLGYKQFMTNNCAKTCARCHLVNITATEIRDCRDRRSDCEEWAAEGFCESSLYTTRQKLKFCGKSCKLC